MAETMLERIRQQIDLEARSPVLLQIPSSLYFDIATYCQKLRRSAGSGSSPAALRLIDVQKKMIQQMSRDLIILRVGKAIAGDALPELLPEERYVALARHEYDVRLDAFVDAVSAGQPSFIRYANRKDSGRNMVVKLMKHVDELVGLDLVRYGPFETGDIASIPAVNAQILIADGNAVEISAREGI